MDPYREKNLVKISKFSYEKISIPNKHYTTLVKLFPQFFFPQILLKQ